MSDGFLTDTENNGPKGSETSVQVKMKCAAFFSPLRVVPTEAEGLTAMSSHLKQAHSSLSIRLTPARDLTVWSRYLNGTQS